MQGATWPRPGNQPWRRSLGEATAVSNRSSAPSSCWRRLPTRVSPGGVSELRRATGLPLATIHRLLATMAARGYVRQDAATHKYTLGSHLIRLGEAATRQFSRFSHPYLAELMEVSGETANLAVFEGGQVAYVAQIPSRHHRVRMFTEVGRRVLPHTSGVGKVVLAFRPRGEVEALLARSGLPRRTPRTITELDRFLAELDTVARQGYAIDSGEEEVGVRCLAVPVFRIGDSVAAMSVSAPEGRLEPKDIERILPEMLRISAALSGDFITSMSKRSTGPRVDGRRSGGLPSEV